jgi:hypothetical protein
MKTAVSIIKPENWLNKDKRFPPSFQHKVQDDFKAFSKLVLNKKKVNKVFKNPAKISPVEFVMMVAVHKNRMGRAQLMAAVGEMRVDVRDIHADVRMNDKVVKTMLEVIRGAGEGSGRTNTPSAGTGKRENVQSRQRIAVTTSRPRLRNPLTCCP